MSSAKEISLPTSRFDWVLAEKITADWSDSLDLTISEKSDTCPGNSGGYLWLDKILVLKTTYPQKWEFRSDPLDIDTDNDKKIDSREGQGKYSSTIDMDTDNDGFMDGEDLNPDRINPTPWFGMNHVLPSNLFNEITLTNDPDNPIDFIDSNFMNRVLKSQDAHMNIFRFDVDVMVNSLVMRSSSETDDFGYKYTNDGISYVVNKEKVKKFTGLAKHAEDNNYWLFVVLGRTEEYGYVTDDGEHYLPSIDCDDTNCDGEEFVFPRRAAAFIHAIAQELIENGDLEAYNRILSFEIENEMNHPWHHPYWNDPITARLALNAMMLLNRGSNAVRNAELEIIENHADWRFKPHQITINYHLDWGLTWACSLEITGSGRTKCALNIMEEQINKLINLNTIVDIIGLDFYPDLGSPGLNGGGRGWSNVRGAEIERAVQKLCEDYPNRKILITETGRSQWSANWPWECSDVEDQKDYYFTVINRMHEYYWNTNSRIDNNLLGVIFYNFKDGLDDGKTGIWKMEENFGIIDEDGDAKRVYRYLSDFNDGAPQLNWSIYEKQENM